MPPSVLLFLLISATSPKNHFSSKQLIAYSHHQTVGMPFCFCSDSRAVINYLWALFIFLATSVLGWCTCVKSQLYLRMGLWEGMKCVEGWATLGIRAVWIPEAARRLIYIYHPTYVIESKYNSAPISPCLVP